MAEICASCRITYKTLQEKFIALQISYQKAQDYIRKLEQESKAHTTTTTTATARTVRAKRKADGKDTQPIVSTPTVAVRGRPCLVKNVLWADDEDDAKKMRLTAASSSKSKPMSAQFLCRRTRLLDGLTLPLQAELRVPSRTSSATMCFYVILTRLFGEEGDPNVAGIALGSTLPSDWAARPSGGTHAEFSMSPANCQWVDEFLGRASHGERMSKSLVFESFDELMAMVGVHWPRDVFECARVSCASSVDLVVTVDGSWETSLRDIMVHRIPVRPRASLT